MCLPYKFDSGARNTAVQQWVFTTNYPSRQIQRRPFLYSSTILFVVLYLHHPPRPRAARSHFAARVRSYMRLLPKNRSLNMCWEGADHLLPQFAAYLALVINIFPQPTVLFIEYTPNPLYLETGLRGLRRHGKISSCYTLGLYLRTQMKTLDLRALQRVCSAFTSHYLELTTQR